MRLPALTMDTYTKTLLYQNVLSLAAIDNSSFEKLFEAANKRPLLKGENILRQGQAADTIIFVESGYLRTFITKEHLEINTAFTFENNFTANLKSLRLSVPSDTTIQAGEKTVVYEFNKGMLLSLYKEWPAIESFGRKITEQLFISQEEQLNLFKIFSPAERYHYLQKHRPEMLQRISLSQLSSYLGIARETLSRIRKIK